MDKIRILPNGSTVFVPGVGDPFAPLDHVRIDIDFQRDKSPLKQSYGRAPQPFATSDLRCCKIVRCEARTRGNECCIVSGCAFVSLLVMLKAASLAAHLMHAYV